MHLANSHQQVDLSHKQNIITSIYIEELLGYYTYSINSEENGRLLIIYGDNGSGKTTLLKLVYYLLSSESKKGHKSILANTRFKTISVTLSNNTVISAKRETNSKGGFVFSIKNKINKSLNHSCFLQIQKKDNIILIPTEEHDTNADYRAVMLAIKRLGLSLYFLQDDRDLLTASTNRSKNSLSDNRDIFLSHAEVYFGAAQEEKVRKSKQKLLIDDAFSALNTWIERKVIDSSSIGESNNQNIYFDLVKSIFLSTDKEELRIDNSNDLVNQLAEIAFLNNKLAEIGLVASFDYYSLIDILEQVKDYNKLLAINNVLKPFIEGSRAKLKALFEIYDIINMFISNVNDYFYDKAIRYYLSEGFSVLHHNGDTVSMSDLSSGEKHLLHLWINSIIAEDATIFIIDEPEISLNIKWQRKLLGSLLSYTKSRNIQFIIATHSIELLANNSNNVVKLANQNSVIKK